MANKCRRKNKNLKKETMKEIIIRTILVIILASASYQLGRIIQYQEILNRFDKNIKTTYDSQEVSEIIFNP